MMHVNPSCSGKDRVLYVSMLCIILFGAGCGGGGEQQVESQATETFAFTEITETAGLAAYAHNNGARGDKWYPETVGAGGGFIDYDGDGWQDILLVRGGSWREEGASKDLSLQLYKNTADGNFVDVTSKAGLDQVSTYAFGVIIADYDNDGDDDFFLTTLYENLLFQNTDGHFEEVGRKAQLADYALWSTAALFFDANLDGWLDLYVGNYVDWSPEDDIWCTHNGVDKSYCSPTLYEGIGGHFYLSNGDGTFAEATGRAGFGGAPGKTLGIVSLDFNGDGWPDLAVANDTQRDLLYKNNGDGTFEEIGLFSGIAFDENGVARAGMGMDAGDVDNNGNVSIFVANYSEEMIGVYRHLNDGIFVNRSAASKIGRPSMTTLGFGLFLFDPNLDGYLDLFVANGHVDDMIEQIQDNVTYRQAPQLFVNHKNGTFDEAEIPGSTLLRKEIVGRGAAYADIDRDGDQDILIIENKGAAYLWRNDGTAGSALRVYVQGDKSNKNGIGVEVLAYVAGEPQARRIKTGGSYLSQSERVVTIGLGMHSKVDSLFVSWPGGQQDRLTEVPGGQAVIVTEGESSYKTLYAFNRQSH